ncbi:MAG: hypothetical protein QF570_06960 [Myxococcota bacterium]|nr:hypothetical protein [Myxococcota bacterium]
MASQDEAEWEDIPARPTRPLPALEDVPPLSRAGSSRIDAEREELEIAVAAAQREIADREAESVGLRGALGAAHQQLRAREAEITDLTTRLAVANATTNARQDELENLGGRYSGVEEKRNVLERETQVLRDELQRAAEEAEKREIKIDNLRSARATLEETIEARNRIIRARDEELAAGEQELQAHRDRIANQYKSVADRDAEIALLQDQLLAEQERTHSLELEVGARDQMLDHQREKLAERDEQLADLLATFDVVERTIKTRPGVADIGEGAASNESTPPAPPQKPPAGPVRTARNDAAAPSAPGTEARDTSEATEDAALDEGDDEDPSPEPEAATSEQDLDAACPDGEAEADQADEPEPPVAEEEAAEPEPMEADANGAEANDADEAEALDATSESDATEDGAEEVTAEGEAASPAETETAATDDQTEEAESAQNEDPFATERTILEPSGDLFLTRPPPRSEIFDWWRDQRIAEGLAPLSVASFDALLADTVGRLCEARPDDTIEVASLCGADATLELRLANALEAAGHENYTIDCIDDREGWHEIRDERASDAGFDDRIDSLPASTAALALDQKIDVFVADGSLAYVADLPALLAWLRNGWKDDSVMVIGGTLGACAAGEAPEHVETIDRIWNVMPDQYMLNHITGSEQANFSAEKPASDAPGGGGPLAPGETPLLPLLLDEFCFEVFAPFGNLINAFVGPEIGANFDPDVEADQQFIETFAKLDEGQIDAGAIHPLHLVAVLRGSASDEPFLLEGRAPERCLALGE